MNWAKEETEIKLPTFRWIIEKAGEFRKNIYFCFIDQAKSFVWITTNWKILKEMEMPDRFTCLLRNLCVGQEATVRTGHGTKDQFRIWKGVCKGCVSLPCLFNLHAEYIMQNTRLYDSQAGIKIAGEISATSDMQMISL